MFTSVAYAIDPSVNGFTQLKFSLPKPLFCNLIEFLLMVEHTLNSTSLTL
jgi:hypothetical protein